MLAVAASFMWGLNYVAVKSALTYFPPLLSVTLRMGILSAVMLPFYPKHPRSHLVPLLIASFTLSILHFGLWFIGIKIGNTNASIIAIIEQSNVPFGVLLGILWLKERVNARIVIGIIIAFGGALVLSGTAVGIENLLGFCVLVIGAFFFPIYTIQVKKINLDSNIIVTWTAVYGTIFAAISSLIFESGQIDFLTNATAKPILSICFSGLGGTLFTHIIWHYLIAQYNVSGLMAFLLLIPILGIAAGCILLGEILTVHIIIGSILTCVGIAVINWQSSSGRVAANL